MISLLPTPFSWSQPTKCFTSPTLFLKPSVFTRVASDVNHASFCSSMYLTGEDYIDAIILAPVSGASGSDCFTFQITWFSPLILERTGLGYHWMEVVDFLLKLHWSFIPRFQLTKSQYWFSNWLGGSQAPSYYTYDPDLWYHMASLGNNESIWDRRK